MRLYCHHRSPLEHLTQSQLLALLFFLPPNRDLCWRDNSWSERRLVNRAVTITRNLFSKFKAQLELAHLNFCVFLLFVSSPSNGHQMIESHEYLIAFLAKSPSFCRKRFENRMQKNLSFARLSLFVIRCSYAKDRKRNILRFRKMSRFGKTDNDYIENEAYVGSRVGLNTCNLHICSWKRNG